MSETRTRHDEKNVEIENKFLSVFATKRNERAKQHKFIPLWKTRDFENEERLFADVNLSKFLIFQFVCGDIMP